jgi:DNA-binding transcriptional LysR family regulator
MQGIEEFLAVAAEGSFVGAARALGMTPSGVGKAIQRLEQRLGVPLFVRTTRRVSITEDGERFREDCERLLGDLDAAEADIDARHDRLAGPIRLSAPVAYARLRIVPPLADFAKRHPEITFDLRFSDILNDPIKDRLDLVVRIGDLPDSSMWARKIDHIRFGLFASATYLKAKGMPKDIASLEKHARLAFLQTNGKPLGFSFSRGADQATLAPTNEILSDDIEAVIALAEAGLGLAYAPTFLVERQVVEGRLTPVLQEHWIDGPPVHVIHPRPRQVPKRVRSLSEALVAHLTAS